MSKNNMIKYPADVAADIAAHDIDMDTVVLRNQPIAREGVLPYCTEDGRVVRKFKRWKDLKQNIGRRVPIIYEHPDKKNGRGGLYNNKRRREGIAVIKQYRKFKMLAADMYFRDDFTPARGYSIGYPFKRLVKPGRDKIGHAYDEIQSELVIDHIALTNSPREPTALQSAWDALPIESRGEVGGVEMPLGDVGEDSETSRDSSRGTVVLYEVAHDASRLFVDLDTFKSRSEIEQKIRGDNPTLDADKLAELVAMQYTNQFRLEGLSHLMQNDFHTDGDAKTMPGTKNVQDKALVESEDPEDVNEKKKKKKTDVMGTGSDALASLQERIAELQSSMQVNADAIAILTDHNAKLLEIIEQDRQDRVEREAATRVEKAADALRKRGYTDEDMDGWDIQTMEGVLIGHANATKRRTQLLRQSGRDSRDIAGDSFGISGPGRFNAHNLVQAMPYNKATGQFMMPPRGGAN